MCKQKIGGDCVVNNNTYYHPACMKVTPRSPVKTVKMCVCVSSVAWSYARSVRIICINFYGNSTKNVAVCAALYCTVLYCTVLLQCQVCEESLRGSYMFFQNRPICAVCIKSRVSLCSVCKQGIEGTCYQLQDQMFCQVRSLLRGRMQTCRLELSTLMCKSVYCTSLP